MCNEKWSTCVIRATFVPREHFGVLVPKSDIEEKMVELPDLQMKCFLWFLKCRLKWFQRQHARAFTLVTLITSD